MYNCLLVDDERLARSELKRLLKAQKRKHSDRLEQIKNLQNELFPNQSLQERQVNFSEFYLENGNDLIQKLSATLKPLETNFEIITSLN